MDTLPDNPDKLPALKGADIDGDRRLDVVGLELASTDPVSTGYDPYNNPPPPVEKDTDVTGRRLALANRLR